MQRIVQQQLPPYAGRLRAQLWPLLPAAPGNVLKVKRDAVNRQLVVGLDGASYSYALEVGRGTIELNVGACDTLIELEALFRAGLARLFGERGVEGLVAVCGVGGCRGVERTGQSRVKVLAGCLVGYRK